jgi:hypothetical protein
MVVRKPPTRRPTRDEILARKVGHGEITIPDLGTVAIRALTMSEAVQVRELEGKADQVYLIISLGMTDPKMSYEDVETWGTNDAAGVLNAISDGIAVVSGMSEGSGKDAYKSPRR